tara:strand:- start:1195 stop:1419 length:225 start_codon:yes stop_codon:yes gene_type:complete
LNDEVKEILIDLVDYYNTMGTPSDPGINTFQHVVQRSVQALERYSKQPQTTNNIDPFKAYDEFPDDAIKMENDW